MNDLRVGFSWYVFPLSEYGRKMDGGKVLADKFLCRFLILVGSNGYLDMLFLKSCEQLLDTGGRGDLNLHCAGCSKV